MKLKIIMKIAALTSNTSARQWRVMHVDCPFRDAYMATTESYPV